MVSYRNISAWIESEDSTLPEYATTESVSDDEVPVISCWIPSRVDEHFTVYLRGSSKKTDLAGYLQIDGKSSGCLMLKAGDVGRTASKDRVRTSERRTGYLKFEDIMLTGVHAFIASLKDVFLPPPLFAAEFQLTVLPLYTDDEDCLGNCHPRLGEIRIVVKAVEITQKSHFGTRDSWPSNGIRKRPIHAQDTKGLKHVVGFTPDEPKQRRGGGPRMLNTTNVRIRKGTKTVVEFIFRSVAWIADSYISIAEKLQADGIIAPDPTRRIRDVVPTAPISQDTEDNVRDGETSDDEEEDSDSSDSSLYSE
ncbi:hypothetical protein V5O48_013563 [Marasmius crinis-equi]|uniref:Uncharacterized protein n=1 Tax=Marasmius crinis-equi TaxID=585013 RepID=A0ABR3EZQ1_9AGAR